MGRDKALLELAGEPMIVRTARLLRSVVGSATAVGSPEIYQRFRLRVIRDEWPGAGPLGGIATALRASGAAWNLVVACDLPHLTKEWLVFLVERARASKAEAVVPMSARGSEPLCAMYNRSCEAAVWLALDRGVRKITEGLAHLHVEYLEPGEWKVFDPDGLLFKNMNSAQDYEEAKVKLSGTKT